MESGDKRAVKCLNCGEEGIHTYNGRLVPQGERGFSPELMRKLLLTCDKCLHTFSYDPEQVHSLVKLSTL
jgi:hypothetical protein